MKRVYDFVFIPTRDLVPVEFITMSCFHIVSQRVLPESLTLRLLVFAHLARSHTSYYVFLYDEATVSFGCMPSNPIDLVIPNMLQQARRGYWSACKARKQCVRELRCRASIPLLMEA